MSSTPNTVSMLRHRLTLQQEVQTPDGAGGYTRSWQNIVDLWAQIDFIVSKSSATKLFGDKLQSKVTHKITIRYRAGVEAGMRFLYDNRIFLIRAVMNSLENNNTLEVLADEGVG